MATIFSDGFESGDFSAWTGTDTTGDGDTSVISYTKHHGSYAFQAHCTNAGGERAQTYKTITATTGPIHARTYIYVPDTYTNPLAAFLLVRGWTGAGWSNDLAQIYSVSAGLRLHWWEDDGPNNEDYATTIDTDTWYCVETAVLQHESEGYVKVWLDGNLIFNKTGVDNWNHYSNNIQSVAVGCTNWGGGEYKIIHDCVVVSDSYIGPETSIPGDSSLYYYYKNSSLTQVQKQKRRELLGVVKSLLETLIKT